MNIAKMATRTLVYITCISIFIISVVLRRMVVSRERAATPISYIAEINKYGKPVIVIGIKNAIFDIKRKFTVVPLSERTFEGFVTRKAASSLKEGQLVNTLNGHSGMTGRISYLSPEVDMMSGLYKLKITFREDVLCDSGKLLLETKVGEKINIIEVPNDALHTEQGKFYLWKVIEGKAHKEEVTLSTRGGYSSIVDKGLDKGDILVIVGQSQLEEKDRVRIIDNKNIKRQE